MLFRSAVPALGADDTAPGALRRGSGFMSIQAAATSAAATTTRMAQIHQRLGVAASAGAGVPAAGAGVVMRGSNG